jgi:hypothetical protein
VIFMISMHVTTVTANKHLEKTATHYITENLDVTRFGIAHLAFCTVYK